MRINLWLRWLGGQWYPQPTRVAEIKSLVDDMPAQSFGGAHRDRVCVCAFIEVSVCACIWTLVSVLVLKNRKKRIWMYNKGPRYMPNVRAGTRAVRTEVRYEGKYCRSNIVVGNKISSGANKTSFFFWDKWKPKFVFLLINQLTFALGFIMTGHPEKDYLIKLPSWTIRRKIICHGPMV